LKSENFLNKVDRYLAAKSNYFGVGGGTMLFEDFIEEMDKFDKEICENIEAGTIFMVHSGFDLDRFHCIWFVMQLIIVKEY
jgi:hypothetical protein